MRPGPRVAQDAPTPKHDVQYAHSPGSDAYWGRGWGARVGRRGAVVVAVGDSPNSVRGIVLGTFGPHFQVPTH